MSTPANTPILQAVLAARAGDARGFSELVECTQEMAYALAFRVLGSEPDARDAVQDAYVVAFQRLAELASPEAFAGWLRRIVVTVSLNHRRRTRPTWVPIDERLTPPLLDEAEPRWSEEQQRLLSRALVTLSREERRLCELHYHAGWSAERLARTSGTDGALMRKRLQRIREKLRKEIEMDERKNLDARPLPVDLPARILELLARPRLVDLPESPVAATLAALSGAFAGFSPIELPEEIDLERTTRELGGDAVYIERSALQRIQGERILRYDLTLPLLLTVRWTGGPQRLIASGKVYRADTESRTHLEAFHQFEAFTFDERPALDLWSFAGRVLDAIDRALPRSEVRVVPTDYSMCTRAFSLDVRHEDQWVEVSAWGEYAAWVLRALGADPEKHSALGVGFGLERIAMLKYGIDDIRKISSALVA